MTAKIKRSLASIFIDIDESCRGRRRLAACRSGELLTNRPLSADLGGRKEAFAEARASRMLREFYPSFFFNQGHAAMHHILSHHISRDRRPHAGEATTTLK